MGSKIKSGDNIDIAVLIPCYNEQKTIEKVIGDFKSVLPQADIYVYDNNSSDKTAYLAKKSGAIVRYESLQGKGNVVRSMFRDIDADVYVLVDGDDTYPAEAVEELISQVTEQHVDLVIGDRLSNGTYFSENKRGFHNFGNNLVLFLINRIFCANLHDIMSGYRVFSYRFVKNYPALSDGFQIETDMTIFALDRKLRITEIPVDYRDRPIGSESKLNTFSDGLKVIVTIFNLYRHFRPLRYFSIIAGMLLLLGIWVGIYPVVEFLTNHYIYKVPSAILASGIIILAIISFTSGIILDSINRSERERFESQLKNL